MHALIGVLLALLTGCTHTSPDERLQHIERQVQAAGWQALPLRAQPFTLMAFTSPTPPDSTVLRVYIEGDGLAWVDPQTPSFDPTPVRALALELALQDPSPGVVYLGRPCQYVRGPDRHGCNDNRWWTSHRFAPEVMASTHAALDALKTRYQAKTLALIGYSGGATVAAVMAAQRSDVQRLITVAGNLDPAFWAQQQRLFALTSLQNPADMASALAHVPQLHFVGLKDTVVPPAVSHRYTSRFSGAQRPTVVPMAGFDHACCWADAWPALLKQAFPETARAAHR